MAKCLINASTKSNIYQVEMNVIKRAKMSFLTHSNGNLHSLDFWYKRLGHLNIKSEKILQSMVSGMEVQALQGDMHLFACEGCVKGKQTRRPFLMDERTCVTKILKLMNSNACGPIL